MSTTVRVLHSVAEVAVEKEIKSIEFRYWLRHGSMQVNTTPPSKYSNIELIHRGYDGVNNFDLMFAYHDDRSSGVLYLGHFNDGVINTKG